MSRGAHARRFVAWIAELPDDVRATVALLDDPGIAVPGRRFLAGALSYLVTQLDLIPDHAEAGAVDDAFVLRLAHGLAAEHSAAAGPEASAVIGRLTNQEEQVRAFLGEALFARLRRYVVDKADQPVRGRTVEQLIHDAAVRAQLVKEIDQWLERLKPPVITDDDAAEALERQVLLWLEAKLKRP